MTDVIVTTGDETIDRISHLTHSGNERTRVLIIKTGYSETLDPDESGIVSLGDILRSTVILSLLPSSRFYVSWAVDESGAALLEGTPGIDELILVTPSSLHNISKDSHDIVINLEKSPEICRLAEGIDATTHVGFKYCDKLNHIDTFHEANHVLSITKDREFKRRQTKSWSELLYEILGAQYTDEPCVLAPVTSEKDIYDFGLNWKVGKKFPLKGWPKSSWDMIACDLQTDYKICWQESENDLHGYIQWINACRVLITNDSLGLHLALALGKKVVVLFGPTSSVEIHPHPNVIKLTPNVNWDCIPCLESTCSKPESCMTYISVEKVKKAAHDLLTQKN